MTAPQPTPSGWYPDPQAPGTERYWDGSAWTATTRPVGAPHHDQFTVGAGAAPMAQMAPSTMSPSDVRSWAIAAHLSALVTSLVGFAFIGPLVIYFVKRDEDPTVRAHAAAALNFQLSWLIWGAALGILTFILLMVFIGILLIPVLIAGAIAWIVFVILAAVKAADGQLYKYPLTINFVN